MHNTLQIVMHSQPLYCVVLCHPVTVIGRRQMLRCRYALKQLLCFILVVLWPVLFDVFIKITSLCGEQTKFVLAPVPQFQWDKFRELQSEIISLSFPNNISLTWWRDPVTENFTTWSRRNFDFCSVALFQFSSLKGNNFLSTDWDTVTWFG